MTIVIFGEDDTVVIYIYIFKYFSIEDTYT